MLFRAPRILEWICGAIGVLVRGLLIVSGLWGTQVTTYNFAPTFIYVVVWVGIPITSIFVGDLFHAFSPWRAAARLVSATLAALGLNPKPLVGNYPERLGRYPAAITLFAFAWLELVFDNRDDPRLLATLAAIYAVTQLVAMACFGIEQWSAKGDGFAVYFSMIALMAPLRWSDRRLYLQWPLLGARALEAIPGTAAVVCVLIGSTSFDGFSNGELWYSVAPSLQQGLQAMGLSATPAYELAATAGLIFWIVLAAAIYRLGIRGMTSALGGDSQARAAEFLHTLLPIAFGYVLAHYFSLLVLQGQALEYLASDPLGDGHNFFGTANSQINYNLVSFAAIWYVQIAAIIAGHVGGLSLSHDRGLVEFGSAQKSLRAQQWMLVVTVAFTCIALWLLSAVSAPH